MCEFCVGGDGRRGDGRERHRSISRKRNEGRARREEGVERGGRVRDMTWTRKNYDIRESTLRLKKQMNEVKEQEKAKNGNEIISKVNKLRQKMLQNYEGRERVQMIKVLAFCNSLYSLDYIQNDTQSFPNCCASTK